MKRERNVHGVGIELILGMTWTKTKRSALSMRFSSAQQTARRLPLPPPTPEPLFTATATEVIFSKSKPPARIRWSTGLMKLGSRKIGLKSAFCQRGCSDFRVIFRNFREMLALRLESVDRLQKVVSSRSARFDLG